MAGKAEDLPLALLLVLFHRCDKAPQELIEVSRLVPLAASLMSSCLWTPAGPCASEAGFCSLFHRDRPSFPPQGPATVATSEFPSCCLSQPKGGRAEIGLPFSSSASVILQRGGRPAAAPTGGELLAPARLCIHSWHGVCGTHKPPGNETLGFGFLAVGEFLMDTSHLWDLAKDHLSPKGAAPTIPAQLSQPRCLSQLLCLPQFWLFCSHKPNRAQSFFLSFPVLKGPHPNKPFPARMVQTHAPQALGCPSLTVTGGTAHEGLNLPLPRGKARGRSAAPGLRSHPQRHRAQSRWQTCPGVLGGTACGEGGAGAASIPAAHGSPGAGNRNADRPSSTRARSRPGAPAGSSSCKPLAHVCRQQHESSCGAEAPGASAPGWPSRQHPSLSCFLELFPFKLKVVVIS